MSQAEIAAYVQTQLRKANIEVVLSGGAAVGIYTKGRYVSLDIDLVNTQFVQRKTIEDVMSEIGFNPVGRHFEHPETEQIIEFPPGPLLLGNARAGEINELVFDTGILRVISPTDCVKDRLAHYYYWGDRQCLNQAIMVVQYHKIDLSEIEYWSKKEGKLAEFEEIKGKFTGT